MHIATVSYTVKKFDEKKAGLYRATAAGQKYVGPVTVANGKAKGKVDVSASLFFAVDETAPAIENELDGRGNGKYAVKVTDAGSGINAASAKVVCNGTELKTNVNDNEIIFDTSALRASSQVFEVEVSDNAGNTSRASVRAQAGVTNLKQVMAYPNPATKGRSVIRAIFEGANPNAGTGSVKIYDMSGHKVMDGDLVSKGSGIYEFEWDTCNKKGHRVANGTYIAEVKININGDSHKERVKIAVLR